MSDGNIFERRRDLVQGKIERLKSATYERFGLTDKGEPGKTMYGMKAVGPAEMRQYVEGIAGDPGLTQEQKIERIMQIRPGK